MTAPAAITRRAGTFCSAVLHTRDIAAAARFYDAVFGWSVDGAGGWATFTLRGQRVACARRMDADGVGWVPCVAVNDVGVATDAALAAGGTIVERGAGPDDTPFSLVRDPDGAVFGVCPPVGRHVTTLVQEAGAIWWVEALIRRREVSEQFYCSVFGWQFAGQALDPHPLYVVASVGDERVGGFLPIGPDWNVAPRWQVLFEVENLERSSERLEAAGGHVEFGPLQVPRAGRLTSVRDPNDALLVLIEPRS